jgi:curved DNA-binding protein CbpA
MELAEETFKEIRGAYEILSDPNERAWYVHEAFFYPIPSN